jgi:hypothetical protein
MDDDLGDDDTAADGEAPGEPWCWTVAPVGGQLAVLQVDPVAGTWFEYGRFGQGVNSSFHTGGIGRSGDSLVMSAYLGNDFQWVELDMAADSFTAGPPTYGVSISAHGQELVTLGCAGLCWYPDYAALISGNPGSETPAEFHASRLGIHGNTVYTAWHSTGELDVHDAITGSFQYTLGLQDYETWVWGISGAGGVVYVIDDGRGAYADQGVRIAGFDPASGANVSNVFLDVFPDLYTVWPSGLWCSDEPEGLAR